MSPKPDCGEESYEGHGRLQDYKMLVTGGDSGIGRAAAIAYAKEGADVALNYYQVKNKMHKKLKKSSKKLEEKQCLSLEM